MNSSTSEMTSTTSFKFKQDADSMTGSRTAWSNHTTHSEEWFRMANYTINVAASSDLILILQKTSVWLWAIIVIVGLIGNMFSVWVIWTTTLRRVPSNHYLVALALSDSLFLIGLFVIWFDRIGPTLYHVDFICKLVVFSLNVASWLSTWFVVALTVERYIVVHWPLHRIAICSVGMARKIILSIIPAPTLINLISVFLTMGVTGEAEEEYCSVFDEYFMMATIVNIIDTLVTLVIPTIAIVGFNIALARNLLVNSTNRRLALENVSSQVLLQQQGKEQKITKTLMIISTVFIVMNLPSYVIRMKNFFMVHFSSRESDAEIVISNADVVSEFVGTILYYSTFAVNFFVYSASSKNFRKAAWAQVSRRINNSKLKPVFSRFSGFTYKSTPTRTPVLERNHHRHVAVMKSGSNGSHPPLKHHLTLSSMRSNASRASTMTQISQLFSRWSSSFARRRTATQNGSVRSETKMTLLLPEPDVVVAPISGSDASALETDKFESCHSVRTDEMGFIDQCSSHRSEYYSVLSDVNAIEFADDDTEC